MSQDKINQRLFYIGIDSVKIKVKILPDNSTKEVDIKPGSKVYDVLKEMQIKPDTVIVVRNDTPIPVDDIVDKDQKLKIIQVASGG